VECLCTEQCICIVLSTSVSNRCRMDNLDLEKKIQINIPCYVCFFLHGKSSCLNAKSLGILMFSSYQYIHVDPFQAWEKLQDHTPWAHTIRHSWTSYRYIQKVVLVSAACTWSFLVQKEPKILSDGTFRFRAEASNTTQ
jgi:hypothetical protein